jgi:hypothetical protein
MRSTPVTPNRDIREMLRRTYTYSVVTAWLALSMIWPASAKIFWMTEPDLRASFSGASIKGEYTNDRSFAERYQATGELAYTEIARKRHMIGRWSIVRNRFCTIYDSSGTGGCFRVHQIKYQLLRVLLRHPHRRRSAQVDAAQSNLDCPRLAHRSPDYMPGSPNGVNSGIRDRLRPIRKTH